jgi:hypothetical protein
MKARRFPCLLIFPGQEREGTKVETSEGNRAAVVPSAAVLRSAQLFGLHADGTENA